MRPGADRQRAMRRWAGPLLLAPSLLIVVALSLGPFVEGIRLSFFRLTLGRDEPGLEAVYVGLRNYVDLARDRGFREALGNTVWWVLGSVIGRLGFALLLAILLKRQMPLVVVFRAIALLPWVMPVAVAGVIWRWIFNGDWGVLNHILRSVGLIERNIIWMSAPGFKWFYMLSLSIWKEYPLFYVVMLARLQMIPEELYQAARIDGAGSWGCLVYVTLPLLKSTLFVLLLLGIIWTTTDFSSMWMLTGRATTLATMAYGLAFRSWHLGYGSTVGVYMVLMLLLFVALYIQSLRGQVSA